MDQKSFPVSLTQRCLNLLDDASHCVHSAKKKRKKEVVEKERETISSKKNKLFSVVMNESEKKCSPTWCVFPRRGSSLSNWGQTAELEGQRISILIDVKLQRNVLPPTAAQRLLTGYMTPQPYNGSSLEVGRVRNRGGKQANYVAKWATWASTGRSCSSSSNAI